MLSLVSIATVFGLGLIGLGPAIPAGLALGMSPLSCALVAGAGALSAAMVVLAAGPPLHERLLRGHSRRAPGALATFLARFGGNSGPRYWGFLGPLLIGTHVAAALALATGGRRRSILLWMSIGTAAVSLGLAYLCSSGWTAVTRLITFFPGLSALSL